MSRSQRRASGGHRSRWLVVLVGAALAGAAGWYFLRTEPLGVELWTVQRGRVEESVANTRAGTVKASRRANVAPSTGGLVAKLSVREGDRVRQGEVLLELWHKDLAAEVKLAENQHMAARARAVQTCLLAEQAARAAQRQRELRSQGIASDDIVDQVVAEAEAGEAACEAARAVAEESTARVEVARRALEKTIVKAPFDGVVATVNVELGEYVTPSPPGIPTPPAVDLIEDGPLYVEAPIDEVDAPRVRPGLHAKVSLDAFSGRFFNGQIRRVAPFVQDVEKQARTVDVEVELKDLDEPNVLVPGLSADVEVLIQFREKVLRLPTEAILDGDKVFVFDDGTLRERQIVTGIANWQFTEVVSGLSEGERIVLTVDREGVGDGVSAVGGDTPRKPLSER